MMLVLRGDHKLCVYVWLCYLRTIWWIFFVVVVPVPFPLALRIWSAVDNFYFFVVPRNRQLWCDDDGDNVPFLVEWFHSFVFFINSVMINSIQNLITNNVQRVRRTHNSAKPRRSWIRSIHFHFGFNCIANWLNVRRFAYSIELVYGIYIWFQESFVVWIGSDRECLVPWIASVCIEHRHWTLYWDVEQSSSFIY